jgi:tetratricopeptide (TPR) repeat protein
MSKKTALLLCFVVVAVCYANSLPNDFVFDDSPLVGSNPAIRSISPIQFLNSPYWSKQQYEGIYRPFTILSMSIDYSLWKRWAPGFRLTNLMVHALNGFLLFLLCTSFVGEGLIPVAAMVIYLLHPVHTEAVTSIVGRSDLFAALFLMSAWLLFRRGKTLWPALLFSLALLSKENAIVLPAILLVDLYLSTEEKIRAAGRVANARECIVSLVPDLRRLLVIIVVALAYLPLRFSVLGSLGIPVAAQYMAGRLSYLDRLMTSGRVFIEYLRLVLFPLDLAGDYDFNAIPIAGVTSWDAWAGILSALAIVVSALVWRRRNWVVSLGLLSAFIVFVPVSNWIAPISVLMAERFLYVPLIGISIAAAVVFSKLHPRRMQVLIGAGAVLSAIVLCNAHDYIRRNDFTFYRNMVRVEPNSAKGRLGYGYALLQAGRREDAAKQFEAGLVIIPNYPELLTTLAMTRITDESCTEAWPLLNRALQIDPAHADTHRRMGDCYFKEGKLREAESMYRQAVDSIPYPDSMLYFMWGRSLEGTGQTAFAVAAYERGALIDPENVLIKEKLTWLRTRSAN